MISIFVVNWLSAELNPQNKHACTCNFCVSTKIELTTVADGAYLCELNPSKISHCYYRYGRRWFFPLLYQADCNDHY